MEKKPFFVDVPVRVTIWTRPECQRKQFEVLKQARPSILFLQSDGGRNEKEWDAIRKNRAIFDNEIDWECEVHKIYEETNQGLYTMSKKTSSYVWAHVDRCIFLEDDYVPAVSFFRFCAELLEKYKDDSRIEMITGNNVFTEYADAKDQDYFFSETGWSIWGTASWRDRALQREYPLPYAGNEYIKNRLKENLPAFWFKKVSGYCSGTLVDGHTPGGEFFHAVNNVLHHRLVIVPTRNMISNIGTTGEHANVSKKSGRRTEVFNLPVFEIQFPIRHPDYVIDDKQFGKMYSRKLNHSRTHIGLFMNKMKNAVKMLFRGDLGKAIKRKTRTGEIEK